MVRQRASSAVLMASRPLTSIAKSGRARSETTSECSSDSSFASAPTAFDLQPTSEAVLEKPIQCTTVEPLTPTKVESFDADETSEVETDDCFYDDGSCGSIPMTLDVHPTKGWDLVRRSVVKPPPKVEPVSIDVDAMCCNAFDALLGDRPRYKPRKSKTEIHIGAIVGESKVKVTEPPHTEEQAENIPEEPLFIDCIDNSFATEAFKYVSGLFEPVRQLYKEQDNVVLVRAEGRLV